MASLRSQRTRYCSRSNFSTARKQNWLICAPGDNHPRSRADANTRRATEKNGEVDPTIFPVVSDMQLGA
jgi:hypothetical protein